jgi:hypothetical protein
VTRLEDERERLYHLINEAPLEREQLEQLHGQVWDEAEMRRGFDLLGFHPPFAVVRRRPDFSIGTLIYQDNPRFYFRFALRDRPN